MTIKKYSKRRNKLYNKSKKYNKKINKINKSKKYSKKRKSHKKKYYSKKSMKGGDFNTDQISNIRNILSGLKYSNAQQDNIIQIFNQSAQSLPYNQLISQIEINDGNIDYNNLTDEQIEQGREDIDRMVEAYTENNNVYMGETDSEKKTNSFE
jgi:hypothetical protein